MQLALSFHFNDSAHVIIYMYVGIYIFMNEKKENIKQGNKMKINKCLIRNLLNYQWRHLLFQLPVGIIY